MNKVCLLVLAAIPVLVASRPVQAQPAVPLTQLADIRGDTAPGRWSTVSVDGGMGRGFIARADGISVIDLATLRWLPNLHLGHAVRTVLVLPHAQLLATGGDGGTVSLVDQASGTVRTVIRGLDDPDEAIPEPGTANVLVVDEDRGALLRIDPLGGRVLTSIALGRKPEMVQADGDGHAWVDLREQAQVAVVDLRRGTVVGHYALARCTEPSGLADIPTLHRLVVACGNGVAKVLSDVDGTDISTIPIGPHPGSVLVVGLRAWLFTADGFATAIGLAPGPASVTRYETRVGSRTGAVDWSGYRLLIPYGQIVGQGPMRRLAPGSFGIAMLGLPGR